jgi:hypothetical protein
MAENLSWTPASENRRGRFWDTFVRTAIGRMLRTRLYELLHRSDRERTRKINAEHERIETCPSVRFFFPVSA